MSTIDFYNREASNYVNQTLSLDVRALHTRFLQYLPPGAHILDAGCGSGRDSLAFRARGYRVTAFDASSELARRASVLIGQPVQTKTFQQMADAEAYDGIWTSATLLHVPLPELPDVMTRLARALKPGGAWYLSFKIGEGERTDALGRHFTDMTASSLDALLTPLPDLHAIDQWETADSRPDRDESWLNVILRKRR